MRGSIEFWIFAVTLIAIGVYGLVAQDFVAIWNPAPKAWPAAVRIGLANACSLVALAGGTGLLWRRTAALAAGAVAVWLTGWIALTDGRFILAQPLSPGTWEGVAESVVIVAAALTLFAETEAAPQSLRPASLRAARVLYGLALIAFGVAHFAYLNLTAPLVPAWLPAHVFWAYFTGAAYIAAGLAVLSGVLARLAATLATVQIAGFTFLVWAPLLIAGALKAPQWRETEVSLALTVAAWVIAASYRGERWGLAARDR